MIENTFFINSVGQTDERQHTAFKQTSQARKADTEHAKAIVIFFLSMISLYNVYESWRLTIVFILLLTVRNIEEKNPWNFGIDFSDIQKEFTAKEGRVNANKDIDMWKKKRYWYVFDSVFFLFFCCVCLTLLYSN